MAFHDYPSQLIGILSIQATKYNANGTLRGELHQFPEWRISFIDETKERGPSGWHELGRNAFSLENIDEKQLVRRL
jgi:hypothetical protein